MGLKFCQKALYFSIIKPGAFCGQIKAKRRGGIKFQRDHMQRVMLQLFSYKPARNEGIGIAAFKK